MTRLTLPYGGKKLPVDVPDGNLSGVLKPKEFRVEADAEELIREALKHPVGTEGIRGIVKKKHKGNKIAVVVDDHTRPCLTAEILPPLFDELYSSGVDDDDIQIIFATGSHRTVTDDEAGRLLEKKIASRINYVSNDCRGDDFVYVGTTSRGTDISVKKAFHEADIKILTGDVEIHYFAGYGGGRKSILPGVSSYETIQENYKQNFFHPDSRPGVLDGNPMYENMTEAARLAGVDFTINVVQTGEGVVGAFAGDFDYVLRKGAELVDEIYKVDARDKADVVVTAANGAPHDIDLYQAYKALHLALNVVKEGGVVILVAECREGVGNGVGHRNYDRWMKRYETKEEMQKELKKEFVIGGHKAFYNLKALEKAKIFLVSQMPKEEVEGVFRFRYAETPDKALSEAFRIKGEDAKVLVIPDGSTTLSGV
jgi:nickel-dependent lactate racemase